MLDSNPLLVAKRTLQILRKPYQESIGSVSISRYDHLGQMQWDSIAKYAGFFSIVSWIVIISIIVLSFFGNSVIMQECLLNMQIIFLHVYIFTQYLPANFKLTVGGGLSRIQNLNYFTTQASMHIEQLLLGNVVQISPNRFTMFMKDINFTRAIYPTVIISILYLIVYGILNAARKLI